MGRPRRMYARGVYHVAAHGSDDRHLYLDDRDRLFFLGHLAETAALLGVRVVSYVLMTNHHHLLLDTPDSRIAAALRRLHGGYARHHNILYGRTAHVFRAHPLVRPIEDDDDLKWTDRYIAHNPVEAGLADSPFDWRWSSSRAHAGLAPASIRLYEDPLRAAYGHRPDWRDRYYAYMLAGVTERRMPNARALLPR